MRYMLLLYADERAGDTFSTADMENAMAVMGAYNDVLKKANAFVATAPLQRSYEASTVRAQGGEIDVANFARNGGELKVHDGPYADTREQLGGFYIIEASGMDEAIEWARKCPAAQWGAVEVREIYEAYADLPA